ncbi:MAG: DEAD/DEAH box helicase family protein [Victivallales bacterium]|nr:DEAD/DEAH box helicase family protein [Victivallales bacterium]
MTIPITIEFSEGTLLISTPPGSEAPMEQWCVYDSRFNCWRCDASAYAPIVEYLYRNHIPYEDTARSYSALNLVLREQRQPRDYQQAALNAWTAAKRRGIVVLPTGTGKTFVAELAIASANRSTLVVVPTIDLMTQWASQLERAFGCHVGMLGGGSHEIADITVSTYDSALLSIDSSGGKFGLLIVDECHHLPGQTYRHIATAAIAPYRLGLSATPERDDLPDNQLEELLGKICFRKEIDELEGTVLADYTTERICVELDEEEFAAYHASRERYVNFLHRNAINLNNQDGWKAFLLAVARRPGGREAYRAYMEQKRIATASRAKLETVWQLLKKHAGSRTLIFTADNKTAYEIGERFRLPVLTHHTKAAERKDFLDCFRSGEYPCLVTSKVLNEGVDVPEAEIGIVVSGSGSIREHVQRLGRILRPTPGKSAILYEIVSFGTSEYSTSDRRRQHRAYERPGYLPM